jgi:hypothetical protein
MKKVFLMVAAMGLAAASFADMNDALLSFATQGPDKYADGTTVIDGECYALVWTANGATFGGFNADGTLVSATDRIVLAAPLAKGGKCPQTLFQINAAVADELKDGTYAVYLLDTRIKDEDGTTKLAGLKDGKAKVVNAQTAVGDSTTAASTTQNKVALAATAVGGAAVTTETIIDAPKITSIKVEGATVKVTVAGMSPAATYKVVTCTKPGEAGKTLDAKAKDGTFEFKKPEGSFFKVIGTRNF